jgi:hypothetical protein
LFHPRLPQTVATRNSREGGEVFEIEFLRGRLFVKTRPFKTGSVGHAPKGLPLGVFSG